MPNKTVYIREGDQELWDKAESIAGGSLSGLLTKLLKEYVPSREEKPLKGDDGMERIVLEIGMGPETRRKVAFTGKWLASDGISRYGGRHTAYYTPKGNIVVHSDYDTTGDDYHVYDDIEAMSQETNGDEPLYSPEFLVEIAAELGEEYVEELDI
ncbi:hypothetical protein [Desulfoscipio gibsoniae]